MVNYIMLCISFLGSITIVQGRYVKKWARKRLECRIPLKQGHKRLLKPWLTMISARKNRLIDWLMKPEKKAYWRRTIASGDAQVEAIEVTSQHGEEKSYILNEISELRK